MLLSLDIRDILIIDRLEMQFRPGLNVLTGETGAGKSILLDALGFVLGWRGRADLVREGAEAGEVTAVFALGGDHPAHTVLDEAGLPPGDELILRRVNSREGRKTGWVNDRRVSGEVLRRLAETLVELHGQHDDRGLLDARGHRAILDAFAGHERLEDEVRGAWRTLREAEDALEAGRARLADLRTEEDWLRHAVSEFEALSPRPGEDAELDAARRLMQGAERVREDVMRAHAALGPEGAEGLLSDAARWIEGAAGRIDEVFDEALAALDRARAETSAAEEAVGRAAEALESDPARLEAVEERLFAIRALARKHQVQPDALGGVGAVLAERLSALDGGVDDISRLEAAREAAGRAYDRSARALTASRREAGARLAQRMANELPPLKLERAVFRTGISEEAPGPSGRDRVEFEVSTGPGLPPGALNRIASGGELSRFLLALKVCLSDRADGRTMIFDEIDRGVGGATADAVGRRLAALANGAQVLVVTHSPQVAARGTHHWRVTKTVAEGSTLSQVSDLDADARVDEVARMLAGEEMTEAARAAARALLKG